MLDLILHTLFTLALCTAAFIGGVTLSDKYHSQKELAVSYELEKQRADLKAGVTPLSPATPYVFPKGKHVAQ